MDLIAILVYVSLAVLAVVALVQSARISVGRPWRTVAFTIVWFLLAVGIGSVAFLAIVWYLGRRANAAAAATPAKA